MIERCSGHLCESCEVLREHVVCIRLDAAQHTHLNTLGREWCGKCTFIRMIGSDEDEEIPTQLILFVKQIRKLCAAYALFDEDGGPIPLYHTKSCSVPTSSNHGNAQINQPT